MLITFIVGTCCYKYIEAKYTYQAFKPIENKRNIRYTSVSWFLCILFMYLITGYYQPEENHEYHIPRQILTEMEHIELIKKWLFNTKIPSQFWPNIAEDLFYHETFAKECLEPYVTSKEFDVKYSCFYGTKTSRGNIVALGDAEIHQWLGPLSFIAQESSLQLHTFAIHACPWLENLQVSTDKTVMERLKNCDDKIQHTLSLIRQIKPDIIIMSYKYFLNIQEIQFRQLLQRLSSITSNLIWIQLNTYASTLKIKQCFKERKNLQWCALNHNTGTIYQNKEYIDKMEKIRLKLE